MLKFLARLIDTKDRASSKRFLGLVMSAFLILSSVVSLFIKVPIANTELVRDSQLYAFLIVCVTLLGMSVDSMTYIILQKAKTQAAAQILTPAPTVSKIETVQGDVTGNNSTTENTTQIGDGVLDDNAEDMIQIKKSLTNSLKEE